MKRKLRRVLLALSLILVIVLSAACSKENMSLDSPSSDITIDVSKVKDQTDETSKQDTANKDDQIEQDSEEENSSSDEEKQDIGAENAEATSAQSSVSETSTVSGSSQSASTSSTSTAATPAPASQQKETVTIGIFCNEIFSNEDLFTGNWNAVGSGTILGWVTMEISSNETVMDVTLRACSMYGISVINQSGYIPTIGGLSEFDCGRLSGWTYYVNGVFANVGASDYTVHNGDTITWSYTCGN